MGSTPTTGTGERSPCGAAAPRRYDREARTRTRHGKVVSVFIVWRRMGWLILPLLLLVWWVAENAILPIYRAQTGFEYVYNAERGVMWGIAFILGGLILLAFAILVLHRFESVPRDPARRAAWEERTRASYAKTVAMLASTDAQASPEVQGLADGTLPLPKPVTSTFFWIPMRFFPYVFAAIGILLIVLNLGTAIDEVALREGL